MAKQLDHILKKARELNTLESFPEVLTLLPDELLLTYSSADLYAEKAQAEWRLEIHDLSNQSVERSLSLDPFNFKANHYKANWLSSQKKYDEAIEHYNKSLAIKPDQAYVYNGLGLAYQNKKDYSSALENYEKAITIDPSYKQPYTGIGNTYYHLKNYKESIKYFKKAIEIDPAYFIGYHGLAMAYYSLKDYDKSIVYYNKSVELTPRYPGVYYNRALAYHLKEKYNQALTDYTKYLDLETNLDSYFAINAKAKIEDLKKLIKSPQYSSISEIVDKIKSTLLYEEICVTHYTSFAVAKKLIMENSSFRISEGTYLNDTSEGRELFDYLPQLYIYAAKSNDTIAKPFAPKPFIGSFVSESKHDDLTLWRMYGKEDNVEARGCAITVDRKKLLDDSRNFLIPDDEGNKSTNIDEEFQFYRVAYRTQDNQFIIPGATGKEETLNNYLLDLYLKIEHYLKEDNLPDKKDLLELLNRIAYLFKSAEYQYEHELRLVVNGTGIEKIINDDFPLKVYIDLVKLNPFIRKLTLGPKVDKADEWASTFYYKLNKQDLNPEIFISRLPFK
jgi:tetratricopeptide (TPR) repeat protein